ncbi:MAG TPA: hypothetical protein VG604_04145 [Candidatus Saccharimonadales bacterium]|nr:hypothetical protein [Candidatus Saccharimonadales bacterium]
MATTGKDMPIERYFKSSRRALTTGLLATSLTLQLYPTPVDAATPTSARVNATSVEAAEEANNILPRAALEVTPADWQPIQHLATVAINHVHAEFQDSEPHPINPNLYDAWTKVAVCEEGGWVGSSGSAFPNSLGIRAANWYNYGGGSDVSPAAQIAVAQRMINSLGIDIPDQDGCQAGGW